MAVNNNLYTIYMHKNKINGKVYIGQTCQELSARWKNGDGYRSCTAFYRAIQKYGWDNFEHIVLCTNLTLEEANEKEAELIEQYHSRNKEHGYNIRAGGSKGALSDETIEKIRQSNLKAKRHISEETRLKLRLSHLGQKPSERQRAVARANSGFNNSRSKPVLCVETGEIFGSSGEAQRKLNIDSRGIRAACTGSKGQKTAGGYHWKFITREECNHGSKQ